MKLQLRHFGRFEIYKFLILAHFSEKINGNIQTLCVSKYAFQKKNKTIVMYHIDKFQF